MKTQCQTETGRVKIPEDYERRDEIEELTDQMHKGDLSRAGEFMEELGALIETLKKEERRADSEYKKASGARDEKRDALTEAGNLEKTVPETGGGGKDSERLRGPGGRDPGKRKTGGGAFRRF